mgnify:FL=1
MKQYKTVSDVISDLNIMIVEAPLPNKEKCQLADIVAQLEQITETVREHIVEKGDSIGLHHDD